MAAIEQSWLRSGPPRTVLRFQVGARDLVFTDHGERFTIAVRNSTLTLVAHPGLTVSAADIERVVAFEVGEDSGRTASVKVMPDFDMALEVESGRDLAGQTAELSQVWPDMEWQDRRVLLTGIISEEVWGGLGEALEFNVTDEPDAGARMWPPSTWYITDSTWPRDAAHRPAAYVAGGTAGRDSSTDGAIYPLIIGYPGSYVSLTALGGWIVTTQVPAVPAFFVEGIDGSATLSDYAILVSGTPTNAYAEGGKHHVYNTTAGVSWWVINGSTRQDQLGQAVVEVIPDAGKIPSEGDTLYSTWPVADGGGYPNPYGSGPLRRADHVLRWCLDQSGLRVDRSRLSSLAVLAGIGIDTYLNESVEDLWTWAKANLIPFLPVRAAYGPGGHYAYAFDLGATADRVVAHIEEDRNAERTSRVTRSPIDGVINKFSISFAPNLYSGLMCSTLTLTGEREGLEVDDPNVLTDYLCQVSQARYGVRTGSTMEARFFYESASAVQALNWLAQMMAIPPIRVSYQLGPELAHLEEGQPIAITSSRLHWTDKVGHIEVISPAGAGIEIQAVIFGAHALLGAGT